MSMLLNLVTSGWFSDPNCIFCNIGWMFCSKGKRGLLHTVHKLAIEFYFMGFHECCNLFGSTHKLMKQKFKWAVNLGINFMHFLTADQQKLGQVTGEKSVDIFLLLSYTFQCEWIFKLLLQCHSAGSPSSRELREGWFCGLPSKPVSSKMSAANFLGLATSYELTNRLLSSMY